MIAEMKRLLLFGYSPEKNRLLKCLAKLQAVETSVTAADGLEKQSSPEKGAIEAKLLKLQFAFDFLRRQKIELKQYAKKKLTEEKPAKGSLFASKKQMDFAAFEAIIQKEEEAFEQIGRIYALNDELLDIRTNINRLKQLVGEAENYRNVPYPFSILQNTKKTSVFLFNVSLSQTAEVETLLSGEPLCVYEYFPQDNARTSFVLLCHDSQREAVLSNLAEKDFELCTLATGGKSVCEIIQESKNRISELEERKIAIGIEAKAFETYRETFEILYDYYSLEKSKCEISEEMGYTRSSFFLTGWIPAAACTLFEETMEKENFVCHYVLREAYENEIPPTFCVNKKMIAPFEAVTNMYSAPRYGEVDPNPFVAVFFFLYFGIMMSDAGYGLILAAGAALLYKLSKPTKGSGKLLLVIFFGGISTIIWGIVFGGYFGISIPQCWFNPLEDPLKMLILSLALGVVQILVGMGINGYALIKQHKAADAFFEVGSWYVFFLGLALFAVGLLGDVDFLTIPAYVALGMGAVFLFLGGARGKKGIFKRVMGGLKNYYNIINYVSDVLSYARLFGLGLATGVIGMVMNTISDVIVGFIPSMPWLGFIISLPILIVGHTFNIAINCLGAFVHDSRLQYIEFFNRFYSGGGRLFLPLGSNMKHVYIEEKQEVTSL